MKKANYKVSVIVPVYNVEKFILESLKSICAQNFSDYQIIIVNDGTKDNSVSIAKDVLKKYDVDYIIIDQENLGLSAARNTGLRAATGKYVVFVDSDDIITPDFIDTLYNACEKNNCKAAFTEYEVVHMDKRTGINDKKIDVQVLTRDELLYNNMLRSIKIHLCAVLLEKNFLIEHNLYFNENLRYGEEVDYTWRLYPLLEKIAYIKSAKYKYLVRENSLMTNQSAEKVIFMLKVIHQTIQEWFLNDKVASEKYRWVEDKIYFEKMHAFAQQSDFTTLHKLLKSTNYKAHMEKLSDFPDLKIKILSRILRYFPFAFWMVFQII